MNSYDRVISLYIKHTNEYFKNKGSRFELFYRNASKNKCYPYGVIKNINDNNSRSGRQLRFDVFIWGDDSTKIEDIENATRELAAASDTLLLKDVSATVYVDAIRDSDDSEFKLVKKLINLTINYF